MISEWGMKGRENREHYATVKVCEKGARFLVAGGREAVVVKPAARSGATPKSKVILQSKVSKISQRGARFLAMALVAKPVER